MDFIVAIVLLNVFPSIKAKQKYISSDIASEYSHQKASKEDDTSGDGAYYKAEPPMTPSIEDFREQRYKDTKKTFESRRWQTSCVKKASKLCTKACRRAFKTVCKRRKCSSRAKRALKRECQKSCPNHFIIDRDRAAYEE